MPRPLIFWVLLLILPVFGAFERTSPGAETMGLGNSLTAYPFSLYTVQYNPAAMIYHQGHKIALNFRTFYGIPGIIQGDLIGIHRIGKFPFGWEINHFGNDLYQEYRMILSAAWPVSETLGIGFSATYHLLSISGYGQAQTAGFNLSVFSKLSDRFFYGAMFQNFNQPRISHSSESLPRFLDIGICYLPSSDIFITISATKETRFSPDIKCGIGYTPGSVITLRLGIQDRIESFNMGFGLKLSKFAIDYAVALHPVLSLSHAVSVLVEL